MKKKLAFLLTILIMLPFLYMGVCEWCGEKVTAPSLGIGSKETWTPDDLYAVSTDFEYLEDGGFASTSNDPWFLVHTAKPTKTIVIDVDEISENGYAQIFYFTDEEGILSEQTVDFTLESGKNYVQIPDGAYSNFRLDLTACEGRVMDISDITFYSGRLQKTVFRWIFLVASILLIAGAYCFYFKREAIGKQLTCLKDRLGEYRFYQLFLGIAMLVSVLLVYGSMVASGNQYVYYDIGGGDQPEAYIPLFVSYVNQIKSGELSSWTFYNGLGTSTTALWGFLLNPFLLPVFVVAIVFGISTMNTMLLLTQILNVLICGLLCYKYLHYFKGTHFSKAAASYIGAFSGYMILYAQHYVHSDFCFYLLLMLIVVEEMLKSKRVKKWHIYFSALCAVLFCASIYIGYMIGLFAGIYVIFRTFQMYHKDEIRAAVRSLLQMLGFACVGIMIAMPIVLPVANELLFNSTRITGDDTGFLSKIIGFLLTPYPVSAMKTIFFRMLSNNLEGTGNHFFGVTGNSVNDYYAAPTLFFSVFILLFIVVYYVTLRRRCKDKKQYIIQWIVGFAVAFLMFDQLGSAVFNAFVATFGRYSYLLMPVFAIVSAAAIDEMSSMQKRRKWVLVIPTMVTFLILGYQCISNLDCGRPSFFTAFVMLDMVIVLAAVVLFLCYDRLQKKSVYLLFVLLIFVNMTLDSYVTVNKRAFCVFSEDLTDEDDYDTMDALGYVENNDSSMYRLEKNYYDLIYYHDAYFQGYRGISTYNSTLNGNVKEFYRMYCDPAVNFYGYDSFWYSYMNVSNDVTQNALLGIRYILSNGTAYPENMYENIYSNSGVAVYQNKAAKSFGTFYTHSMLKSEVEDLGYIARNKVLSKAVVLEDQDALQNETLLTDYEKVLQSLNQEIVWENSDEIYVRADEDVDANAEIEIEFETPITDESAFLEFATDLDYGNNIQVYFDTGDGYDRLTPYYHRGTPDGSESEARVLLPQGTQKIRFCSSREDMVLRRMKVMSTTEPVLPEDAVPTVEILANNHIAGTLQNDTEGYLFLPIPYEKGWQAFVDGREMLILKADSGFMAIPMDAGNHEFELKYAYPGIKIGMIVALAGVTVLVITAVCLRKRKGKEEV